MTFPLIVLATTALLGSAAPNPGPWPLAARARPGSPADTVPLYTNLGTHHKRISTRVPAAQQYFDQGLRLVYGFNHAEAIRSFGRAAELDSSCAMCYLSLIHISEPTRLL